MATNTNATLEQMKELKLHGMALSYEQFIRMPINQQPTSHEMIAQLLEKEAFERTHRRTQMYLRLSKLRYAASLEQVICSEERNLSKDTIAKLADCSFVSYAQNILITGATGCGKSYLACALGHQACLMGFKTLYLNMNRFIEKISLAKLEGTYLKLLNRIEKIPLLILDDFGLQPLQTHTKLALLQILEDRYSKKATIISSQLPIDKWYDYIDDATFADAILDRLTTAAHRIELKGKSLRKKEI